MNSYFIYRLCCAQLAWGWGGGVKPPHLIHSAYHLDQEKSGGWYTPSHLHNNASTPHLKFLTPHLPSHLKFLIPSYISFLTFFIMFDMTQSHLNYIPIIFYYVRYDLHT